MEARERLVASTQELLWERGYVGTSPKAIQRHAEVGQGSMYHHFTGKADLATAAILRSAEQLRERVDARLSAGGTAMGRIRAYLREEREILRVCRLGRLAQDPDILSNPVLRRPIEEAFRWLQPRLAIVIQEGQGRKEIRRDIDAGDTAAAIAAVLQGGYVLARAAGSTEPFERAIQGLLRLLELQTRGERR